MICSIPGCDRVHYGKGFCQLHYRRLRTSGDPNKTPTGRVMLATRQFVEDALKYESDECLIWPFGRNKAGYAMISVNRQMAGAHRVICERVYGPPPDKSYDAAHTCGKGFDGCVSPHHLRWKTRKENSLDKVLHGTHVFGENVTSAKLTESSVRQILDLKGVMTAKKLASMFGVTPKSIRNIGRKTWMHMKREGQSDVSA